MNTSRENVSGAHLCCYTRTKESGISVASLAVLCVVLGHRQYADRARLKLGHQVGVDDERGEARLQSYTDSCVELSNFLGVNERL